MTFNFCLPRIMPWRSYITLWSTRRKCPCTAQGHSLTVIHFLIEYLWIYYIFNPSFLTCFISIWNNYPQICAIWNTWNSNYNWPWVNTNSVRYNLMWLSVWPCDLLIVIVNANRIGNWVHRKSKGNSAVEDGERGIHGIKTKSPACLPPSISHSMTLINACDAEVCSIA